MWMMSVLFGVGVGVGGGRNALATVIFLRDSRQFSANAN